MAVERITVGSVVVDVFCQLPGCGRGYLGSLRFTGGLPPAGMVFKRGRCHRCRRWQWVDAATGVVRTRTGYVAGEVAHDTDDRSR